MNWYATLGLVTAALASAAVLNPLPQLQLEAETGVTPAGVGRVLALVNVGGFACALGAAVWVTFVAGVVLFRSLPRHQFGQVQSQLFPAYFLFLAFFSCLSLAAFSISSQHHQQHKKGQGGRWQLLPLVAPATGALLNLLLLEPLTSKVMKERHRIEKDAGIGNEVGLSRNREVAKTNPQLAAINKRFGFYHGLSSLANLVGLMGLVAHLWFLASHVLL